MDELIEALQIFRKYKNERWPTNCQHDVFYIMAVTKDEIPEVEQRRLKELGFLWNDTEEVWQSFRFGSA